MFGKKTIILASSLLAMTLWGCGSSYDSSSEGSTDTLATALRVGMDNCLTCHNPGSSIIQAYMSSRHGNRLLIAGKNALAVQDIYESIQDDPRPDHCGHCHPTTDSDLIDYTYLAANEPAGTDWNTTESGVPLIGCEECHGGGQYHNGIPAGIPYPTPGPKQCGRCHYLNDNIADPEWVAEGEYPHHTTTRAGSDPSGDSVRRNILDSHVDDPSTGYNSELACDATKPATYNPAICAPNVVEGYVIRYDQQNGCVDCHFNGHLMDLTKNFQWAESGHGGTTRTLKTAALAAHVTAAGPPVVYDTTDDVILTDVTAAGPAAADNAFVHYDWDAANRQSCQMCHTSTGASNFLSDPTNYDPANNDFSHLVGWSADDPTTPDVDESATSDQNEMLYCWGCHSDSNGTLRNPGAVTLAYTYNSAAITMPDVGNSNVCINCHSGRGNASDSPVSTSSYGASHHGVAGAVIYSDLTHVGGEFVGQSYAKKSYYAHGSLGTADDTTTGNTESGPCVMCHMNGTAQNHTMSVVTKDAVTDAITAINADVCVLCHDGEHALFVGKDLLGTTQNIWDGAASVPTTVTQAMIDAAAVTLEEESAGYENAGELLTALLANTVTNYTGVAVTASSGSDNDHRAFQNGLLTGNDAGGFAHNRYYVKWLLFDSIDWLENGALDGTIADYTATYPEAMTWFGGTTRP